MSPTVTEYVSQLSVYRMGYRKSQRITEGIAACSSLLVVDMKRPQLTFGFMWTENWAQNLGGDRTAWKQMQPCFSKTDTR